MNKALILTDYQREWIDNTSEYFIGDITSAISRTNILIDYCRKQNYKIIFTKHIEIESENAFAEDSSNVELIDTLHKEEFDSVIIKHKISPFFKTDLEEHLKGIEEIIVSGILTNLCVRSLIQDAYDRDFDITVIKDCCVAFDDKTQEFTFNDLKTTRPEINFIDLNKFIK